MLTTASLDAPIGRLAAEHPELLPVLDRFGLDYCCHGRQTLAEACRNAGADPRAVLKAIDQTPDREPATHAEHDWASASMCELADHIEALHHRKARESFDRLSAIVPRVLSAHADRHPELREVAAVVEQLREEMMDHMVREERVLFPWLRRLERPTAVNVGPPWSVQRPIDCMEHDHASVADALARLRRLTSGYQAPTDACRTYESLLITLRDLDHDTRVHIHKENNILFPAGIRAEKDRAHGGLRSMPAPLGSDN
ncbi:MAG: iron-sulfur cluster repair di-iron protein [Phycisphaeraceae bacterium]|nr:iron-sulfur cluster repair di-iron protein [Phycisphaeraceae bacterium]